MQDTGEQAAAAEAEVGGDEDGAGGGGRPEAHGESVDRRIEEDSPAGHHEAEGGEAGEGCAPRFEEGDGDDGIAGEV